jgi:hypothetical protein
MRSIRSSRVAAFNGTVPFSLRIIRSRSCSCTTTTSLASVNSRWQKGIVNMAFRVEVRGDQYCERQECLSTEMRLFSDLGRGGFARQHPNRNLQTLPGCVNDADRAIAPLGLTKDLQDSTAKRVKGIEDLNLRIIRAQGIVGEGATIRTCIAWFQPADYRPTTRGGLQHAPASSCRCAFSAGYFGESSWLDCGNCTRPAN